MSGTFEAIALELANLVEPLAGDLSEERFLGTLEELGVVVDVPAAALLTLRDQAVVEIDLILDTAGELRADIEAGNLVGTVTGATTIIDAIGTLTGIVDDFAAHIPGPLPEAGSVGRALLDRAVVRQIERSEALSGFLTVVGVIERTWVEVDEPEEAHEVVALRWDRLLLLVTDPGALLADAWGWGGPLDRALLDRLVSAVHRTGIPTRLYIDDDGVERAQLFAVDAWIDGTALHLETAVPIETTLSQDLPLVRRSDGTDQDEWTATVDIEADLGDRLAATVSPGSGLTFVGPPDLIDEMVLSAAVTIAFTGDELSVLEIPGLLALTLDGFEFTVGVTSAWTPATRSLALSPVFEIELVGLRLGVDAGGLGPFLGSLLTGRGSGAGSDIAIGWGAERGLIIGGSGGLEATVPVQWSIGPVSVEQFTVGVSTAGGALTIGATADLAAAIGPFAARLDGLGVELTIGLPSDGAGFSVAVTPTLFERIGLSITTEAITGGGFLEIDATRYAGALSIQLLTVGISAITVIDTELPGNPDAWAFFAALALDLPSIPIGFGFTLEGVGGLVALNRGFDEVALASGLRSGVVDSLLFPEDPIGDAATLIAQIDDYFPLTEGNTVFGPIVAIGWGSPTLITAELGVIISLPEGVIAVLGSISALIPDPDAPLLTLHMDVLGVVDVPGGTVLLMASLYDSRLLATISLSGDMAMYLATGTAPAFLLSVGGYHPSFDPGHVPAPLHDLRRMQAAIVIASNVNITVEAYFAVTSNTVQFGAAVNLEASVEIWPATYTARGWFGFDVLLIFSPFKIAADMSAGVGIYSGNKELMGVQLAAHLEGPSPWFASGFAEFRFFGLKVKFELEVGGKASGEPKPLIPVRQQVLDALGQVSAWEEAEPTGVVLARITYVDPAGEQPTGTDEAQPLWIRPDHQVRVRQSIAPLNRQLEIMGQGVPPPDEAFLSITGAGFGATPISYEEALDWFAPAQFEDLGRAARLERESFEEMTAGVSFGEAVTATTPHVDELGRSVEVVYEESVYQDHPVRFTYGPDAAAVALSTSAAGTARRHLIDADAQPALSIDPVAYTAVRVADGIEAVDILADAGLASGGVSQAQALAAARSAGGQFLVVTASAAIGATT